MTTLAAFGMTPATSVADLNHPREDVERAHSKPETGSPFGRRHCLTIVIPALNEEESIRDTVQRCLDAREEICAAGEISRIEIVVVSDGSTDRTAEIAQQIATQEDAVSLIVFPRNRGYGAAIKAGFEHGTGI